MWRPTYSMFDNFTTKGTQLMSIYPKMPQTKYERWYYSIISNAKCQPRSKGVGVYYESHHIHPTALGGPDTEENLVLLTAREHFICHWLLYKFCKGNAKYKMFHAWNMMIFVENENQKRYIPHSKIYDYAKNARALIEVSDETRKNQSNAQKGKIMSPETRQRIANTLTGMKKTEEHKKNLSKALKGKKKTPEHLKAISDSRIGHKWTEEQKSNLKKVRPMDGKNNPSFTGWYETPWGSFDTPDLASESAPFKITVSTIRKYCKYRNEKVITNNHPARIDYVGKTPKEIGYGFRERGLS